MHMANNLKKNGAITAVYDISADTLKKAADLVSLHTIDSYQGHATHDTIAACVKEVRELRIMCIGRFCRDFSSQYQGC